MTNITIKQKPQIKNPNTIPANPFPVIIALVYFGGNAAPTPNNGVCTTASPMPTTAAFMMKRVGLVVNADMTKACVSVCVSECVCECVCVCVCVCYIIVVVMIIILIIKQ